MSESTSLSLSPAELRAAAVRLRSRVDVRINQVQGGVPTFFDAYLARLIEHLLSTEAAHGWQCQAAPVPGTESGSLAIGLRWLQEFLHKHHHERFVPYGMRRAISPRFACEIGAFELAMSQGVSGCLEWMGQPIFKTVFDFGLVPMLLQELKPATILEIGSGTGASARWMADLCVMAGQPARILSVDIQQVDGTAHPFVEFGRGDVHDPASLFPAEILRRAARPWLLVEDAHVNVLAVLRHFDAYLRRGDYLIVEDSRDKHEVLGAFVTDRYQVDTRYTDFFGRNATSAEDAIFAVIA